MHTLILAPMEGVTDYAMRRLLTEAGGIDLCVSEFIRISENVPPLRVIRRWVPEADRGWKTASGVPVIPQILGGDPDNMAATALMIRDAGAPALDINFGCPAKTVNRHDGGAALLKCPDRIRGILEAIRRAVGGNFKVTAKIRLGWENPEDVFQIAQAVQDGGADGITIHARTRAGGYQEKAQWNYIAEAKKRLAIPVTANGDIRSAADLEACAAATGCEKFMIGRGAIQDPLLFRKIKGLQALPLDLPQLVRKFAGYLAEDPIFAGKSAGRVKQFVKFLADADGSMPELFERIKTADAHAELLRELDAFLSLRKTPPNPTGVLLSA